MEVTVSTNSDDSESLAEARDLQPSRTDFWWPIAAAGVVALAVFIRFYRIDVVPLHHDEGVNGFFLTRLLRQGVYAYDPANYHGPTLYYFALPFVSLLGLNTFAIRCVTVVFGVAIVWLILELRRDLGRTAVLAAALLVAVSPGAVYFSRYFIHETIFVFLSLAIIVCSLRYWQTRRALHLYLAAASIALLTATKETSVITFGVFLIALAMTWVWMTYVRNAKFGESPVLEPASTGDASAPLQVGVIESSGEIDSRPAGPVEILSDSPERPAPSIAVWAGALALAAVVFVCFYSSFFTSGWTAGLHGIADGLRALGFWAKTAESEHTHPWNAYLKWLWQMEGPLSVLGAAGAFAAIVRRNKLSFFIALWAAGILAAYSLVPYKTPWLTLNFIPPLALLAGIALDVLFKTAKGTMPVAVIVLLAAVLLSGYRSIGLNFYGYDDDRYAYVYAHTRREFLDMVSEIYDLSRRSDKGTDMTVAIESRDYWPLPWYLRDYGHVSYFGATIKTDADLVITPVFQDEELQTILANGYRKIGIYTLRPGVDLSLYIRADLPLDK